MARRDRPARECISVVDWIWQYHLAGDGAGPKLNSGRTAQQIRCIIRNNAACGSPLRESPPSSD
jgi:hypothetical protein